MRCSENLPRQLQLLFGREFFVEFLHVAVSDIIPLRSLINSRYTVKVSQYQFLAQEERVIRVRRQIVVADAEFTRIGKAAFAVETDVALKENSSVTELYS